MDMASFSLCSIGCWSLKSCRPDVGVEVGRKSETRVCERARHLAPARRLVCARSACRVPCASQRAPRALLHFDGSHPTATKHGVGTSSPRRMGWARIPELPRRMGWARIPELPRRMGWARTPELQRLRLTYLDVSAHSYADTDREPGQCPPPWRALPVGLLCVWVGGHMHVLVVCSACFVLGTDHPLPTAARPHVVCYCVVMSVRLKSHLNASCA